MLPTHTHTQITNQIESYQKEKFKVFNCDLEIVNWMSLFVKGGK